MSKPDCTRALILSRNTAPDDAIWVWPLKLGERRFIRVTSVSSSPPNVKYTDRVRLHPNLARSRAKSGTRRCWSGFNRRPAARTIADRFLAAALLQQPLLQAFGRVAIHSTVQPAALFGALRPLFLGGRPVTRRILRLRHSGCRHENRQGNREHVVSFDIRS